MSKQVIYVSTDVEADGKIPGRNSMLSFASAAFTVDKVKIDTFSRNLLPLAGAVEDADTMEWWNEPENKAAYAATRINAVNPEFAMREYEAWLRNLPGNPVFVGYPAVYDFKWVDWYSVFFLGKNPFGFSGAIDIKNFAWGILGGEFRHATKRNFPKAWFDKLPHTHVALDDAIEQGALFINILRAKRGLPKIDGIVLP